MSSGHDAPRGPWNEGPEWQFGSPRNRRSTGGDGFAAVNVAKKEVEVPGAMAARTALDTTADPITGADLDSGQAAGSQNGCVGHRFPVVLQVLYDQDRRARRIRNRFDRTGHGRYGQIFYCSDF